MADRLVELQEDVKRQERQAMFGRIAAGLVHDLSHPIQNIGNSARLLLRDDLDAESREMFQRTIERELATLKRFMDDLRNIVKPKPIERFALDVNASVAEIVDSMRAEGERAGVAVEARYADGPLIIDGDRFALGRVYRNLITNAIQATAAGRPGGDRRPRAPATTSRSRVTDTGSGIPADRLSAIFDDFVTTKRRGLGLGLAISKRIVEQLDGTITVESEVGRGTSFTLRFPARDGSRRRRRAARRTQLSTAGQKDAHVRTLVKTEVVAVDDRGITRCGTSSCAPPRAAPLQRRDPARPGDRIILDDDSVSNLEARAARLVPATVYSRMLARATAA